jgi:hypothetical protein
MFAGPGVGIVGSGLLGSAMVAWQWRASAAWIVFGLLAALLSVAVWRVFRRENEILLQNGAAAPAGAAAPSLSGLASPQEAHGKAEVGVLAFAYGIAGFGYIVTRPSCRIARAAIPGSLIDLFWPICECPGAAPPASAPRSIGCPRQRRYGCRPWYRPRRSG